MFKNSLILFLLCLFTVKGALASQMVNMKLKMHDNGLEKIVTRFLQGELFVFENLQKKVKPQNLDFISKFNKTTWDKLPAEQTWEVEGVYPFPTFLTGKSTSFEGLKSAVPTDIYLTSFTALPKFGHPQISCKKQICHIRIEILSLKAKTDLLIKNSLTQESIIDIKGLQVFLSKGSLVGKNIYYEADLELKETDDQKLKLHVIPNSGKLDFPIGSIDLQVNDGNDLYKQLKETPNLIKSTFGNKHSYYLLNYIQTFLLTKDVDWVSELLYGAIGYLKEKQITTIVSDLASNFDFHDFSIDVDLPTIILDDIIDETSLLKRQRSFERRLAKCHTFPTGPTCYFSEYNKFVEMASFSCLDSVKKLLKYNFRKLKTIYLKIKNIDENEFSEGMKKFKLSELRTNLRGTRSAFKKVSKNIKKLEKIELGLKLEHFFIDKKNESSQLIFNVKNQKESNELSFSKVSHKLIPNIEEQYDVAMGFNIETINSVIKWYFQKGHLNFCKNSYDFNTCRHSGIFETKSLVELSEAPTIKKQGDHFVFEVKGSRADFKIWGLPTDWIGTHTSLNLSIPFKYKIANDGHDLSFELVGEVDSNYDFGDTTIKSIIPRILTVVHAPFVSILLGLNDHKAAVIMGEGVNLNNDDSLIKRLVKIESSQYDDNELIIYLNIKRNMTKHEKIELLKKAIEDKKTQALE